MRAFDFQALDCLAAIVEEGGFERAAERLSITQSAVSQRLRTLEAQAGTVLIVRSRPLRPTRAGRLLLRHAMQWRLLRSDLERELHDLEPAAALATHGQDRISIAINADSIATWALPALTPLVAQGLPLEIITDDQDFTHDWLRDGAVQGCVTTLKRPLRGCKVVGLGAMPYVAVAQPEFARLHCPAGLTPHNFRDLPFVAFNRKDGLQAEFVRRLFRLKRAAMHLVYLPSSEGQVRAVRAGWGVSVVPELQARPWIAAGQLVDIAPSQTLPVALYWHCWKLDSALLDALTEALTSAAARALTAS